MRVYVQSRHARNVPYWIVMVQLSQWFSGSIETCGLRYSPSPTLSPLLCACAGMWVDKFLSLILGGNSSVELR